MRRRMKCKLCVCVCVNMKKEIPFQHMEKYEIKQGKRKMAARLLGEGGNRIKMIEFKRIRKTKYENMNPD